MKKLILFLVLTFVVNAAWSYEEPTVVYKRDELGNQLKKTVCYKTYCEFYGPYNNYTGKMTISPHRRDKTKAVYIFYDANDEIINSMITN